MNTVYGRANSMNVQIVMWGLAEIGQPCERLDYGLGFGGTDTPDYLAMNPNGLVPVFRDDDVTLFESGAILRYLAARYARAPFWPEDPVARAPVDMWAEWAKTTLHRQFLPIFWASIRPVAGGEAAQQAALAAFDGPLGILESRLREADFVTGPDLALADIMAGVFLFRYFTLDIPRPEYPALAAYYARLCARQTYAEHVMVSYDALRAPPV